MNLLKNDDSAQENASIGDSAKGADGKHETDSGIKRISAETSQNSTLKIEEAVKASSASDIGQECEIFDTEGGNVERVRKSLEMQVVQQN